ncbi:hypothetical protein Bca52824_023486 [Brassica carinata]|uniref:Uncharacterized protein n=1 Tax=Brassica carinata TaxID=52824 RepID=A0A8X7VIK7_BRACI|nr:hypothetical protein Bca52824_023486 [Brassica carinata]
MVTSSEFLKTTSSNCSKELQWTSAPTSVSEHTSSFTRRELVQETYTKDEINEMFTGLLGERKWEKLSMEKSLEEATDKLRSEMNWMFNADQGLLKKVKRLELELEDLRTAQNHIQKSSISIDGAPTTSIDTEPTPSTTYSKHEVDESLGDIWKKLKKGEARLSSKLTKTCKPIFHNLGNLSICTEEIKRSIRLINEAHADMNPAAPCNPFGGLTRMKAVERKIADIHFLVDKEVEELALRIDTIQQEAEKFQRQLDYQAASIASIDELNLTSIDRRLTKIDGQMKLFAEKLHENLQKQKLTDEESIASIDIQTSEICTRADLDKLADEVYTAITSVDYSQDRRLDQTYFPLVNEVGSMESSIEGMQKEIKAIRETA